MRIVGGRLRGRPIEAPASRAIRPTSDRLREAIFNILAHAYDDAAAGARVLDLFAGTGALGLEALSRGASFALFVDKSGEAQDILRANIGRLGLGDCAEILRGDATLLRAKPAQRPFTLAFLDPPYGSGLSAPALTSLRDADLLEHGALCVVEEARGIAFDPPASFELCDQRTCSAAQAIFLRFGGR